MFTRIKTPILVINGSLDLFQTPAQNLPNILSFLLTAENPDITIHEAPGINHIMQQAKTGLPTEYAELDNPISIRILTLIKDWIKARTH